MFEVAGNEAYSDTLRLSNIPTILIDNRGTHLDNQTFRIFHIGWIDCREAFHTFSPFITLCNGSKISEYEAYWLADFLLINIWVLSKRKESHFYKGIFNSQFILTWLNYSIKCPLEYLQVHR